MDDVIRETRCAACGSRIGDEAYGSYLQDATFLRSAQELLNPPPSVSLYVHVSCRGGWTLPDGHFLYQDVPSFRDRVRRCEVEASRQSLSLQEVGQRHWSINDASGSTLAGTFLSGDRWRLPDGREIPLKMTLAEVEDFLKVDHSVDR